MIKKYTSPTGANVNLNLAPDWWYRPAPSNGVNLSLSGLYIAPDASAVDFHFQPTLTVVGYVPSFDLALETDSEPYKPTFDLGLGDYEVIEPSLPVPTVIPKPYKTGWGKAKALSTSFSTTFGAATQVDKVVVGEYGTGEALSAPFLMKQVSLLSELDNPYLIQRRELFSHLDAAYKERYIKELKPKDIQRRMVRRDEFIDHSSPWLLKNQVLPARDTYNKLTYNQVRWYGVERIPIYSLTPQGFIATSDIALTSPFEPYLPTVDLGIENIVIAEATFDAYEPPEAQNIKLSLSGEFERLNPNYINLKLPPYPPSVTAENELIGYEPTPIQPTGTNFVTKAGKSSTQVDQSKAIKWGYGLNDFVIGGSWGGEYEGDTTPPPEPDEPINHPDYGVYTVVNIVNMAVLPDNTPVQFDDFKMQYDIDSFAWSATFNVSSAADYSLIRPVGRDIKDIVVTINGEAFKFFVATVKRTVTADKSGKVITRYQCQAWSSTKKLAHPYAPKKSFTDTTQTTAAQAVTSEAQPRGFTVDWDTVDWNIPANVHGYQDKTALGAILGVVNSVGGVIIPNDETDGFTVRPRFPISPWEWDSAPVDRTMNETRFFNFETNTVPKENPDGVYVYGEESGVGVKAVRIGRAGIALLPDVVDKYMTENVAAQERGRIEVANNSFIDLVTMSTYIDENGIIRPLDLIEFTDLDGNLWRGQVMSIEVACKRVGTALAQSITVARFFDDE